LEGNVLILAGGTDTIPLVTARALGPCHVVDIKAIPELRGIRQDRDGYLHIGAAVSVSDLLGEDLVVAKYPALAQAAQVLGSYPVRNRATIGGNVCRAAPSGDLIPPLLIYEARAVVCCPAGQRVVTLDTFFIGPRETILARDDILVELALPPLEGDWHSAYAKYSPRRAMDLAVVGVAVGLRRGDRQWRDLRIALGAVGPTPLRARKAEGAWKQKHSLTWREIGELAAGECEPIDDLRASAAYRRHLVRVLVARTLSELAGT
jgi:carbon-monoxide dehydrogenase medium subunit